MTFDQLSVREIKKSFFWYTTIKYIFITAYLTYITFLILLMVHSFFSHFFYNRLVFKEHIMN